MYRASLTHKAMRRTRIGARDGVVDGEDDGSLIHCPHLSRPTIQSVHSRGASSESPRKRFISERVHCYEISSGQINPRPLRSIPPEVSPVDMSADRNIEAASNFSKESIVPMGGHSFSSIDGKSSSISNNNENGILALIPIEHNSAGHRFDSDESPSEVNTPAGDTKTRAALRDKLRRAKISEAIKAFENSMPFSEKRCQESVLDDVIDYIKFLKLQLKVLSQSRLGGEAETFPFVQLEGYGHYLLHPQMSSEPLEEVMGQMLETDMQAANELLESKGLTILPCDLAYALL
ncbi:Myc-type basic helix-loop-helix (bHLH) domain-containing protein [Dioscorea alata]|uniref:Myc-type basic helix-loop-helix (BHLH) domain-containing protein n=1 Tax=Dioscorea alata TaxID=55571 RepID=A0ACB7VRJ8_DIOAL|nr:Myc-type basic helix-loop-helix (bHLH) domain-containing protein [Dioscorea alata]